MHIVYLHQYYCPEGGWGNDRSADFARRWVAAGHRVRVVTTTAYFPPSHEAHRRGTTHLSEQGVEVEVHRIAYAQRMGYGQRAWAFMRFFLTLINLPKRGAEMIYASSTPLSVAVAGRLLAWRWRVPWVFETVDVWPDVPDGMGLLPNRWLRGWLYRIASGCYRSAAGIVALSEGMKAQIASHGVAQEKVTVIENGTDCSRITPGEPHEASRRLRVVYAGAMGLANGLDALVEAAALCARQVTAPDWQLDLYGDGSHREALEARIRELRMEGHIRVHAPVPKSAMATVLRGADVGVVCFAPYAVLEANSANKFFDYLAAGLPVVINYGGWQAQVLTEQGCGLSSPQGDIAALAANLLRLLEDHELRRAMGQRARQLAEARYDRAELSARALRLLESVTRR